MRAKLQIDEKILFSHYVEVEVENEEKLKELDKRLEREFQDLDEVCEALKSVKDVKLVDVCWDDSGSPDEFEVLDWYDQRD